MRTTEQVEQWLRDTIGCQSFVRADTASDVKIFHSTDPTLHQMFMLRLFGLDPVIKRNEDIGGGLISTNYVWSCTMFGRVTVLMMADAAQHFPAMVVVNTYYAPREVK